MSPSKTGGEYGGFDFAPQIFVKSVVVIGGVKTFVGIHNSQIHLLTPSGLCTAPPE